MNQEPTALERLNNWIRNSVTLKLIAITILVLLLLIPSTMIRSIIQEREFLNSQAFQEVSDKWGNSQLLNGPVLTIPVIYEYEQNKEWVEIKRLLHILPEELTITGEIAPEKLRRGIYEVVVYKSGLNVSGRFAINPRIDPSNLKKIEWDQAFLTMGISDLRGIEDQVLLRWQDDALSAQPGSRIPEIAASGITVELPLLEPGPDRSVNFQFALNLQGSQNLSFTPIGSITDVRLSSSWPSPSFNGNFIPDERDVSDNGFSAHWNVLQLNRNFPQSWTGNDYAGQMKESVFGVDLMLPLDDYQKSMRSAKYAIMTIALTFLIFFLVEVLTGRKIHPFQYILVGLALCLFYVLLVSISEHSNFNLAYLISTFAVVSTISLYSTSVFKSGKFTMILLAMLIGIYAFLFVTLQLADYALPMGSIGLMVILSATMYFTRNIDWYRNG